MQLVPYRSRRKPEIQISPLIDVIFLLLIFYAVTTQFVTDERLKLELPEAKTAEQAGIGREEAPPEVTVSADGAVFIGGEIVPDEALEDRIRELVERAPDKQIIVKGDRVADYGVVVKVLDIARSVGASGVQMSAQKPADEP
jgi:biopolymer transport protein ExbD